MKQIFIIGTLLVSVFAFGQMPAQGFECRIGSGYTAHTASEIKGFMTRAQLENFRLRDQRVTLTFTEGFDVILLSAHELKLAGLISDETAYQQAFPPKYELPVFHLSSSGLIGTMYTSHTAKISVRH